MNRRTLICFLYLYLTILNVIFSETAEKNNNKYITVDFCANDEPFKYKKISFDWSEYLILFW